MIKTHLEGILNAIVHRVTNAGAIHNSDPYPETYRFTCTRGLAEIGTHFNPGQKLNFTPRGSELSLEAKTQD